MPEIWKEYFEDLHDEDIEDVIIVSVVLVVIEGNCFGKVGK